MAKCSLLETLPSEVSLMVHFIFQELNDHLCSRTFIIGNYLSIADLFLFQCIHPFMVYLIMLHYRYNLSYLSVDRGALTTGNTRCMPRDPQAFDKVKVSPIYDPYVGDCLLERTLVLSHRLFEVGWPVPFLAAFISPVFPPGTHLLLGGQ